MKVPRQEEKETPFLRTPLRAKTDEILDLSTKEGAKYYERATKSLYDNGPKFDVEPTQFWTFIDLLNARVRDLGMLEVDGNLYLDMGTERSGNTEYINPITKHGRYNHDDMMEFEAAFVNTFTRKSQNSKVLFDLLMNSLSTTGLQRIHGWKDQYHIDGNEASGCLFKVIVRESYIDSIATTNTIRETLSSLDKWIQDNGSDITKFNAYVLHQLDALKARGEQSQDITVNLFKAYLSVKDKEFLAYIRSIRHRHEDGSKYIKFHTLMHRADDFYKTAITRGEWEKPTPQDKQVLALQAKVNKLSKDKQLKNENWQRKKDRKQKNNNPSGQVQASGKAEKPDWLKDNIKPAAASLKDPKTWNNIKWHFCCPETGGKCKGNWRTHLRK